LSGDSRVLPRWKPPIHAFVFRQQLLDCLDERPGRRQAGLPVFQQTCRVSLTGRDFMEWTLPTDASTQRAALGILGASRGSGSSTTALYTIQLADTKRWQKTSFPDVYLNIGDTLALEILEIYLGKTGSTAAITEIVLQGAH
jgi:hypothetical protein